MQSHWIRIATAVAVVGLPSARAADWYTGAGRRDDADAWIVAVDAATSATSQGAVFSNAQITAAPVGTLLASGPRLRFDGLFGTYRTRRGDGQQAEAAALAGYAWVWPDAELSAYLGVSVRSNDAFGSADLAAGSSTGDVRAGVKGALDLYARPTAATMIQASASYASAANAHYGRLRAGLATFAGGYAGPEVAVLGDDFYRQWRVGLHLTGLRVGPLQLGLAAGYASDRDRGGGAYTTVDLRTGF